MMIIKVGKATYPVLTVYDAEEFTIQMTVAEWDGNQWETRPEVGTFTGAEIEECLIGLGNQIKANSATQ